MGDGLGREAWRWDARRLAAVGPRKDGEERVVLAKKGTRGATFRGGVVGVSPALCSRVVLAGRLGREGDKGKETRSRSPRVLPRPLHGGLGEF